MSSELAILVPVLNRPHRVAPLLDSIESTVPRARVIFLADVGDSAEIAAIQGARDPWSTARRLAIDLAECAAESYAAKINRGVVLADRPMIFLAADDLDFKPGWFEEAKAAMVDGVEVVGVNDLLRRQQGRRGHATHFLLTREYTQRPTIDGGRGPLCERYTHNFVDDELIATAKAQGVYAYAPGAHVEHLHHLNGKAVRDATYRLGEARFTQDQKLFAERRPLWTAAADA